jgi:hypothetical protein
LVASAGGSLQTRDVLELKARGQILTVEKGVSVDPLDYKILTAQGLKKPFPMTNDELGLFPMNLVRVVDGRHKRVEGWMFVADLRLKAVLFSESL